MLLGSPSRSMYAPPRCVHRRGTVEARRARARLSRPRATARRRTDATATPAAAARIGARARARAASLTSCAATDDSFVNPTLVVRQRRHAARHASSMASIVPRRALARAHRRQRNDGVIAPRGAREQYDYSFEVRNRARLYWYPPASARRQPPARCTTGCMGSSRSRTTTARAAPRVGHPARRRRDHARAAGSRRPAGPMCSTPAVAVHGYFGDAHAGQRRGLRDARRRDRVCIGCASSTPATRARC